MKLLDIIDQFIDDREFRNVIVSLLKERGFKIIKIDDVSLRDDSPLNDNDILAEMDGMKYTVQTFLNKEITEAEVNEVAEDMIHEHVSAGILITNTVISKEIKEYADNRAILIWDRDELS